MQGVPVAGVALDLQVHARMTGSEEGGVVPGVEALEGRVGLLGVAEELREALAVDGHVGVRIAVHPCDLESVHGSSFGVFDTRVQRPCESLARRDGRSPLAGGSRNAASADRFGRAASSQRGRKVRSRRLRCSNLHPRVVVLSERRISFSVIGAYRA